MIHTIQRSTVHLYSARRQAHTKKYRTGWQPSGGVIVTLIMQDRSGAKVLFPAKPLADKRFD
jgi:hypothetical protein